MFRAKFLQAGLPTALLLFWFGGFFGSAAVLQSGMTLGGSDIGIINLLFFTSSSLISFGGAFFYYLLLRKTELTARKIIFRLMIFFMFCVFFSLFSFGGLFLSFIASTFIIGGLHLFIFGRGIGSIDIIGNPKLATEEQLFQFLIPTLTFVTILLATVFYFLKLNKRVTKKEALLQTCAFFSLLGFLATPIMAPLIEEGILSVSKLFGSIF